MHIKTKWRNITAYKNKVEKPNCI